MHLSQIFLTRGFKGNENFCAGFWQRERERERRILAKMFRSASTLPANSSSDSESISFLFFFFYYWLISRCFLLPKSGGSCLFFFFLVSTFRHLKKKKIRKKKKKKKTKEKKRGGKEGEKRVQMMAFTCFEGKRALHFQNKKDEFSSFFVFGASQEWRIMAPRMSDFTYPLLPPVDPESFTMMFTVLLSVGFTFSAVFFVWVFFFFFFFFFPPLLVGCCVSLWYLIFAKISP